MKLITQKAFTTPQNDKKISNTPLIIHCHEEKPADDPTLLVLVHGLGGSRYGTWGKLPEFLFSDFPNLDIGLYEYRSGHKRLKFWESIELSEEAEVMAGILRDECRDYRRIILCGHSMGGLLSMAVLRYFIVSNQTEQLKRFAGLILMGTPQAGSQRTPGILSPFSKDARVLKSHGDFVTELDRAFTDHFHLLESDPPDGRYHVPAWVVRGVHDFWVDKMSSCFHLPSGQIKTVRGSHTGIVKPESKSADSYNYVRSRIEKAVSIAKNRCGAIKKDGPQRKVEIKNFNGGIGHVDHIENLTMNFDK